MNEPIGLTQAGATWWHTDDYASPNLSKSSMGTFFNTVLSTGAYIGEIWVFNHKYNNSAVYVSVYMTEEMKDTIEANTKFRFRPPPVIKLNSMVKRLQHKCKTCGAIHQYEKIHPLLKCSSCNNISLYTRDEILKIMQGKDDEDA